MKDTRAITDLSDDTLERLRRRIIRAEADALPYPATITITTNALAMLVEAAAELPKAKRRRIAPFGIPAANALQSAR